MTTSQTYSLQGTISLLKQKISEKETEIEEMKKSNGVKMNEMEEAINSLENQNKELQN